MEERSACGSGGCVTCPFSDNLYAWQTQNYGCLPESYEIIQMKKKTGHNWACHSDETVMCGGYANWVKNHHPELDLKQGNLISYETWYHKGEAAAIAESDKKQMKVEGKQCSQKESLII